jgi:hypothetical protein
MWAAACKIWAAAGTWTEAKATVNTMTFIDHFGPEEQPYSFVIDYI